MKQNRHFPSFYNLTKNNNKKYLFKLIIMKAIFVPLQRIKNLMAVLIKNNLNKFKVH